MTSDRNRMPNAWRLAGTKWCAECMVREDWFIITAPCYKNNYHGMITITLPKKEQHGPL